MVEGWTLMLFLEVYLIPKECLVIKDRPMPVVSLARCEMCLHSDLISRNYSVVLRGFWAPHKPKVSNEDGHT